MLTSQQSMQSMLEAAQELRRNRYFARALLLLAQGCANFNTLLRCSMWLQQWQQQHRSIQQGTVKNFNHQAQMLPSLPSLLFCRVSCSVSSRDACKSYASTCVQQCYAKAASVVVELAC
jgi:hypothetical protein